MHRHPADCSSPLLAMRLSEHLGDLKDTGLQEVELIGRVVDNSVGVVEIK